MFIYLCFWTLSLDFLDRGSERVSCLPACSFWDPSGSLSNLSLLRGSERLFWSLSPSFPGIRAVLLEPISPRVPIHVFQKSPLYFDGVLSWGRGSRSPYMLSTVGTWRVYPCAKSFPLAVRPRTLGEILRAGPPLRLCTSLPTLVITSF